VTDESCVGEASREISAAAEFGVFFEGIFRLYFECAGERMLPRMNNAKRRMQGDIVDVVAEDFL